MDDRLRGPINVVSPNPVRNYEFTSTLGKFLHRPTLLPVPASILRGVLGEMGKELLLASTKVKPIELANAGFIWRAATLEEALPLTMGQ